MDAKELRDPKGLKTASPVAMALNALNAELDDMGAELKAMYEAISPACSAAPVMTSEELKADAVPLVAAINSARLRLREMREELTARRESVAL